MSGGHFGNVVEEEDTERHAVEQRIMTLLQAVDGASQGGGNLAGSYVTIQNERTQRHLEHTERLQQTHKAQLNGLNEEIILLRNKVRTLQNRLEKAKNKAASETARRRPCSFCEKANEQACEALDEEYKAKQALKKTERDLAEALASLEGERAVRAEYEERFDRADQKRAKTSRHTVESATRVHELEQELERVRTEAETNATRLREAQQELKRVKKEAKKDASEARKAERELRQRLDATHARSGTEIGNLREDLALANEARDRAVRDLQEAQQPRLCLICMDRPASHALVPCGCRCICEECEGRLRTHAASLYPGNQPRCPACRQIALDKLRIRP